MLSLKYLLSVLALLSFSVELENCGCLVSRLEHHHCKYKHSQTAKPGKNQYGDYVTRVISKCGCEIRKEDSIVNNIQNHKDSIFYIKSPNKLAGRNNPTYKNQKLTLYNIQCAPGKLTYIDMEEVSIEDTKCFDPNVGSYKCVDFVEVRTPFGGTVTNNCGTDKTNLNGKIIPFNSIEVIFRSNPKHRYPGFEGVVQCFSPGSQINQTLLWEETCEGHTHEKVKVPYGQNILYQVTSRGSKLTYVSALTNRTIKHVQKSPIRYLMVHSLSDIVSEDANMRKTSDDHTTTYYYPYLPTLLHGPGMLFVPLKEKINFACFQDYDKYTSIFQPNEKDKELIRVFNNALKHITLDEVQENVDNKWCDLLPSKKNSINRTDVVPDQVIYQALEADLSNPILRMSVDLLLKALERDNPERLRVLKLRQKKY